MLRGFAGPPGGGRRGVQWDDLRDGGASAASAARPGAEDAVIRHEIDAGLRDEDREFLQELDAPEDQRARTVGLRVREREADATVGEVLETVLGQRRTEKMVTEPFERAAILGADGAATGEIEIGGAGVTRRAATTTPAVPRRTGRR